MKFHHKPVGAYPNKIVGVGMNKTGTSTLRACLQTLGIGPVSGWHSSARRLIENNDVRPLLKAARRFAAMEDRPWNVWEAYQALDREFPGSKFILTTRDPATWWRSVESWLTNFKPEPKNREVYCRHLRVEQLDRDTFIRAYHKRNDDIKAYFAGRPQDFLVIDWEMGEGWEKLCPFLGKPVPTDADGQILKLPHRNKKRRKATAD